MTTHSVRELVEGVKKNQRRAIARALTMVENNHPSSSRLLELLMPSSGKTKIFGITGAPGAGKSTLINSLISSFIEGGLKVAVLAVDPSSPFSGGAILGDRARMFSSALEDMVYIRSTASRGQLGGLSPRTPELLCVLDSAGFDIIIVETVGVGQAELDIMKCSDLVTLVLSPYTGDSLQTLKAGIIEIADIYVLNKSDLAGIHDLERDLLLSLSLGTSKQNSPQIYKTSETNIESVRTLKTEMLAQYEKEIKTIATRKQRALTFQFEIAVREYLMKEVLVSEQHNTNREKLLKKIHERTLSPRKAAEEFCSKL